MNDFDRGLVPLSSHVADLASDPEGLHWARECGWVPGTGHCRNRPCGDRCLFRAGRQTEAALVHRSRQLRRPAQRAFSGRTTRVVAGLLYLLWDHAPWS